MSYIQTDYRALAHAGQEGLPLRLGNGVVAIGNFDGVHRGHQALLAQERALADANNLPLVALTFSPHPRRFFQPDIPPFLLSDPILRRDYLLQAGADAVVDMQFDGVLARTEAAEFVKHILVQSMHVSHIVVGENFTFGAGRRGNVALLHVLGQEYGFRVTGAALMGDLNGQRVSSERVRQAVRLGHMATAEDLLGRPWQTRHEVIRGDQRGRAWGFPTANMMLNEYIHPAYGIYAARITVEGQDASHKAVMSFGKRPHYPLQQPLLEAHLLDFEGDLYGKVLRVQWCDYLRPEKRFASEDLLRKAIAEDVQRARELLSSP